MNIVTFDFPEDIHSKFIISYLIPILYQLFLKILIFFSTICCDFLNFKWSTYLINFVVEQFKEVTRRERFVSNSLFSIWRSTEYFPFIFPHSCFQRHIAIWIYLVLSHGLENKWSHHDGAGAFNYYLLYLGRTSVEVIW